MKKYRLIASGLKKPIVASGASKIKAIIASQQFAFGSVLYYDNVKWFRLADFNLPERCQCGRQWTDSENGQPFIYRYIFIDDPTPQGTKDFCNRSPICQYCFYKEEYLQGHWCPKFWKDQFDVLY